MHENTDQILDKRIELAPLMPDVPPVLEPIDEPELPSEVGMLVTLGQSAPHVGRADRVVLDLSVATDKIVMTGKTARILGEQLRQASHVVDGGTRLGKKLRVSTKVRRKKKGRR